MNKHPRSTLPVPPQTGGRRVALPSPTVSLISLGCPKNLVDSEKLMGSMATSGFIPMHPDGPADVLIVNTCSFIGEAQRESEEAIQQAIRSKKKGRLKGLVVAGCHAQRFGKVLAERFPEVDAVVGVSAAADIAEAAHAALNRSREQEAWIRLHPPIEVDVRDDARFRLTPKHWAYLRISEGCDHACTFCAIPSFRGKHRSKPFDQVLAEARELIASGASELLVIGEDTTAYGIDLDRRRRLGELLSAVSELAGLRWVRLMYAYPTGFDEATLAAIAERPTIAKYVDIPFQHTASRVLKRMNRKETREDIFRIVARLRERVPGIAIRSTFIAGFPGETPEDHETLLADLAALALDRVGCFAYSPEGSPVANRLDGAVDETERKQRRNAAMETQQKISWAKNRARIGSVCEVVIDAPHPELRFRKERSGYKARGEPSGLPATPDSPSNAVDGPLYAKSRGVWIARSQGEAPEIDGHIELRSRQPLAPGKVVRITITHAGPYDLAGVPADEAGQTRKKGK